jgi:hypothetical protein
MSEESMPEGETLLSRESLHKLVWEMPGTRLAASFGISDVALAKACRRLDVPRPPPGWWAKKAAGHKVKVTPLPKPGPATPDRIRIKPTPETAQVLREKITSEAERHGTIAVPERLTRPHPLIAGWLRERRERQRQARRESEPWRRSLYSAPDWTATERRRHRVLHVLFRTLEREGADIRQDDRSRLTATLQGEAIAFELREKLRQVTRQLTAEEKRWETWNRSGVRKELQPTGFLQFTISAWTEESVRKNWLESNSRPIEGMLAQIVATFLVLAPTLAERSRQREEASRRWEEDRRRAEEERQRRREDDNRWRRFLEIAGDWKQAALAREFIAALRAGDLGANELVEGRSVAEWTAWAEQRAAEMDPTGHGLEELFADVGAVRAWTYRG